MDNGQGSKIVRVLLGWGVPVLVSSGLVMLALNFADFGSLTSQLNGINPLLLLGGFLLLLLANVLRAWRFTILIGQSRLLKCYGISSIHYFLNRVLPVRAGEISLPLMFKKYFALDLTVGVSYLVFLRLLDFLAMLILFSISLMFVEPFRPLFLLVSSFLLVLLVLLVLRPRRVLALLILLLNVLPWVRRATLIAKMTNFLNQAAATPVRPDFIVRLLVVSVLNWGTVYLYYFTMLNALSVKVSLANTVFATSFSSLTLLLPVSGIGNIGTFESGWAAGFFILGIAPALSIPAGFVCNIYATACTAILALIGYIILRLK